jgi:hypothetical protein
MYAPDRIDDAFEVRLCDEIDRPDWLAVLRALPDDGAGGAASREARLASLVGGWVYALEEAAVVVKEDFCETTGGVERRDTGGGCIGAAK